MQRIEDLNDAERQLVVSLQTALFQPKTLTLILSPGHETQMRVEFANGSRILCMPGPGALNVRHVPFGDGSKPFCLIEPAHMR